MTESQNSMFHDFSMTIFIFQVFHSPWEPCDIVLSWGICQVCLTIDLEEGRGFALYL